MELQKTKHAIKLGQWSRRIAECRSSGKQVREWCQEQGISPSTYYRWQRQVWEAGVSQAQERQLPERTEPAPLQNWARLEAVPGEHTVTVEISGCRITVSPDTDSALLAQVCRTLKAL